MGQPPHCKTLTVQQMGQPPHCKTLTVQQMGQAPHCKTLKHAEDYNILKQTDTRARESEELKIAAGIFRTIFYNSHQDFGHNCCTDGQSKFQLGRPNPKPYFQHWERGGTEGEGGYVLRNKLYIAYNHTHLGCRICAPVVHMFLIDKPSPLSTFFSSQLTTHGHCGIQCVSSLISATTHCIQWNPS